MCLCVCVCRVQLTCLPCWCRGAQTATVPCFTGVRLAFCLPHSSPSSPPVQSVVWLLGFRHTIPIEWVLFSLTHLLQNLCRLKKGVLLPYILWTYYLGPMKEELRQSSCWIIKATNLCHVIPHPWHQSSASLCHSGDRCVCSSSQHQHYPTWYQGDKSPTQQPFAGYCS